MMSQITVHDLIPNANPPSPHYSMLIHIEHLLLVCNSTWIEKTTLNGVGEGQGGIELFMVFHY